MRKFYGSCYNSNEEIINKITAFSILHKNFVELLLNYDNNKLLTPRPNLLHFYLVSFCINHTSVIDDMEVIKIQYGDRRHIDLNEETKE